MIAENWDFLLLRRRNLALAVSLLCSHLSGFSPGTGCDTWNFEVQGIQRTWLHSLLGERRNFWVTDGSFQLTFLEMDMWISRRKSWALASMMGKIILGTAPLLTVLSPERADCGKEMKVIGSEKW